MRLLLPGPGALCSILVLLLGQTVCAQEPGRPDSLAEKGLELLRQTRLAEAERLFLRLVEIDSNNADARYYLALSRSLQGKLDEGRAGFEEVLRLDPRRADACFEIAGILIKKKNYHSALSWAERGLRFSPHDPYGLDLTGTAHFLTDSKIQALRCWNRLNRPHMTELQVRPTGSASRQRIAEEIRLAPGDLLSAGEIEAARWRLRQHRTIRSVKFQPVPGPTPDQYSLEVVAETRRGFGSRAEFLFNTFSTVGFRTWRLTYWDLAGRGVTSNLVWRWRSNARWAQVDFDLPRPGHLPVYAGMSYDWRDESWYLSGNPDQAVADFRLRTHEAGMRILLPLRVPRLSLTASVAARRRVFGAGAILDRTTDGQAQLETARAVSWFRLAPVLQLHGRNSEAGTGFESRARGGLDFGRAGIPVSRRFSRLLMSWENRADWISRDKLQRTLLLGAHAGRLSKPALAEDHFVLGVGPDAEFWLRAHPFLRGGKPGLAPMAGEFVLGNMTAATDIKSWKWVKIGVQAYFDLAQIRRPYPGHPAPSMAMDLGLGLELGSPLVPSRRFILAWGHDARTGRDVLYLTTSFR